MKTIRFIAPLTALLVALPFASVSRATETVWNGSPLTFIKASGADWTLPENQDRITENVWLTRAITQGLFNIKTESSYAHSLSPADTEWAYGTTASYASLTYTDWETWTGGPGLGPPSTIGLDAVVHLISEDIYADIRFTSWGGNAGGVSYVRSTAPAPEPGSLALLGVGAVVMALRRRPGSTQAGGRMV